MFESISTIVNQTRAREAALPLMPNTGGSQFLLQPEFSDKVCVFFHGFTATPEQFMTIGEAFFAAGYNVLIPLLPGHGIAGNWDRDNPPPLPEDRQVYQDFGLYWLEIAQYLGKEVVIGGLSGGSTLAAWLALKCPDKIHRSLLFAPYLAGSNTLVDLFVRIFDIYFEWRTAPGAVSFGYGGFEMPALRVFLDMGADILAEAKQANRAAPMLIVSSDRDRAVDDQEHKELFESVIKYQPHSWYYCFDKVLNVPHNMMTEAEGNKYVDLLIAIAKAYAQSNITWMELEAIRDMMQQGYSYNRAIEQLHLQERVSPDLSTMTIVIDR